MWRNASVYAINASAMRGGQLTEKRLGPATFETETESEMVLGFCLLCDRETSARAVYACEDSSVVSSSTSCRLRSTGNPVHVCIRERETIMNAAERPEVEAEGEVLEYLQHWYGLGPQQGSLLELYKTLGVPKACDVDDEAQENGEGASALLGGAFVSEQHAKTYDALCLAYGDGDGWFEDAADDEVQQVMRAKVLKALRGLHRSPQIPCTTTGQGIVCVDLEAARFFLESYFGFRCVYIDGDSRKELEGLAPFWFHPNVRGDEDEFGNNWDEVLNTAMANTRALTTFKDYYSSPRQPGFLDEGKALPAFEPILAATPKSASAASAASAAAPPVPPPAVPMDRSESLSDVFNCCLCLSIMKDPASLPCGHSGCIKVRSS